MLSRGPPLVGASGASQDGSSVHLRPEPSGPWACSGFHRIDESGHANGRDVPAKRNGGAPPANQGHSTAKTCRRIGAGGNLFSSITCIGGGNGARPRTAFRPLVQPLRRFRPRRGRSVSAVPKPRLPETPRHAREPSDFQGRPAMTVYAPFRFAPIHRWVYFPEWGPAWSPMTCRSRMAGRARSSLRSEPKPRSCSAGARPQGRRNNSRARCGLSNCQTGAGRSRHQGLQGMVRPIPRNWDIRAAWPVDRRQAALEYVT